MDGSFPYVGSVRNNKVEASRGGPQLSNQMDPAGGDPADIAGMGNKAINSSIGPSWNQGRGWLTGSRKEEVKAYAKEMAKEGCPMAVDLSTCDRMQA